MNLNEVLHQSQVAPSGISAFDSAPAAPQFDVVPPGIYVARLLSGEVCRTWKNEEAYRMRFEIMEGDQSGKTLPRTWTFSADAISYTKSTLAIFGLTTSAALRAPFPPPGRKYVVRLVVALRRGDDDIERNDIKAVKVLRVEDSPAASFMLPDPCEGATQ